MGDIGNCVTQCRSTTRPWLYATACRNTWGYFVTKACSLEWQRSCSHPFTPRSNIGSKFSAWKVAIIFNKCIPERKMWKYARMLLSPQQSVRTLSRILVYWLLTLQSCNRTYCANVSFVTTEQIQWKAYVALDTVRGCEAKGTTRLGITELCVHFLTCHCRFQPSVFWYRAGY
jgi:hypothetical protein